MSFFNLAFIAIGVSMDAVAVSIAKSICKRDFSSKDGLVLAFWFAVFQGGMPLLGWLLGSRFEQYIIRYDHWVAFVLLLFVGGKMVLECFQQEEKDCNQTLDCKTILLLAIATSIDALAVGLSFAFLSVNILKPVVMIGLTTFVLCLIASKVGNTCGRFLEKKANLMGGMILILMGSKILIEHMLF